MKHIVIDGRMISWPGIGRYSLNLIKKLEELDQQNRYTVIMKQADQGLWQPSNPNYYCHFVNIEPYSVKEQLALPLEIYKLKPDLVHFTSQNAPILYMGKQITTIHDLILFEHSTSRGNDTKYWLKQFAFRAVILSAVRKSAFILTDTKYIRDQIIQKYGRSKKNVIATYLGMPSNKMALHASETKEKYILCVGSFFPHKNLARLVDAFKLISKRNNEYKLIFVGKDDHFSSILKDKIRKLGIDNKVEFKGFVPDDELASLYQNASLYVFPSLSEGFGLPGLEAMSYGTPVASSNATCLPEVYGDAAVYFDPTSVDDMARVISDTLNDKELLAKLRKAGPEHAKKFSWEKMARETLEVYEKALKR